MSEIKGQILGIILVLAIFGAIGAALKGVFSSMKDSVVEQVETITNDASSTGIALNLQHF